MTIVLIDDQLLGQVLRGRKPRSLAGKDLYTTGHWYLRLCQAALRADGRTGVLSGPFAALTPRLRAQAMGSLLELPPEIGVLSLRELGPTIADLRGRHQLNVLAIEALASASRLDARVFISAPSPLLERALIAEGLTVRVVKSTG